MAEDTGLPSPNILAVIVLYNAKPSESAAFRTLKAAIANLPGSKSAVRTLLYDNTPGGCDPGPLPEGVLYESAEHNSGLANAYNRALELAPQQGASWLLILDQDTSLPADYLARMGALAAELDRDTEVAVIVPRVVDAGRAVAPVFLRFWGVSYVPPDFRGTSSREIHSTNSASLFRVSALQRIGGFNPYFWLDYVDGYIFHQMYAHGMKVFVANDIQVQHDLSLLHGGELKPDRFRNILQAESAYWDLYGGSLQKLFLVARLLGRIQRQRSRGHDSKIRELTWKEFKRRILQTKRRRIRDWKREMEQRIAQTGPGDELFVNRPKISVCMAAYNGERYIEAQLMSILSQLGPDDEVIVVEDASSDSTAAKLRLLCDDRRIRLIEHQSNMGVARSFEDAISAASGDIVFLSDQDDLWAETKVATVLGVFQLHPDADLVVSDAALIDEEGDALGPSYYAQRGKFRSGVIANVIRCSYLGCTMAFRSRIRKTVLPFPAESGVLHDLWIGVSNARAGGKTLYIDAPLVKYRRHSANATGNQRLTLARRLRIRWELCRSLANPRPGLHSAGHQ